ncbi:MAG: response regulator [Desulfobacterales bacterium]|nr:response regulator [Desulfobacterales bacterium]
MADKEVRPNRILIVDDVLSMQRLLSQILNDDGFYTDVASDGEQALDILRSKDFDIVLTDIGMPVMDGLALTRKVTRTMSSDVIIMTGQIDQYSYDQMINLGASDYIQKPFSPEEIILRVKRVLRERHYKNEAIRFHEEKAQSLRLESIGQLAAGIAHEINTPIQYIGDNTTFIQDSFLNMNQLIETLLDLLEAARKDRVDKEMLSSIEAVVEEADFEFVIEELPVAIDQTLEGVSRIKEIIRAMKDFSHPGGENHSPANLNNCIKSTAVISKNEWKYVATLELDLDEGLPPVRCNPGELNQVFLNLIVNASHAIADRLGEHTSNKGEIRIATRQKDDMAEISISDTGSGIPEEILDKVFDPFFTTKEIGKGTGQGLAITRSIVVKRHNGNIDIHTDKDRGTTFTITLPITDKETT